MFGPFLVLAWVASAGSQSGDVRNPDLALTWPRLPPSRSQVGPKCPKLYQGCSSWAHVPSSSSKIGPKLIPSWCRVFPRCPKAKLAAENPGLDGNELKRMMTAAWPQVSAEEKAPLEAESKRLKTEFETNFALWEAARQRGRAGPKRDAAEFQCDVCGQRFEAESALRSHETEWHCPCSGCGRVFTNESALSKHQTTNGCGVVDADDEAEGVLVCELRFGLFAPRRDVELIAVDAEGLRVIERKDARCADRAVVVVDALAKAGAV